jgi:hypothetical protein
MASHMVSRLVATSQSSISPITDCLLLSERLVNQERVARYSTIIHSTLCPSQAEKVRNSTPDKKNTITNSSSVEASDKTDSIHSSQQEMQNIYRLQLRCCKDIG